MSRALRLSNTQKRKIRECADQVLRAYSARRFDMCEQLCKRLEALQPDNADAAFFRGAMLLAISGVEQALPYMQQAVQRAPGRIDFQINLGSLYLQNMQYRPALDCFHKAEGLNAHSVIALLGCSQSLTGLTRIAESRAYLERVRQLTLRQPQEYLRLAIACREMGDMQQAMDVLDGLLKKWPDFVEGMYTKAYTAMQMGDREGADQALGQTLSLDPRHAQALILMAESGSFTSEDDVRIGMVRNALDACPEMSGDRVYILNAMGRIMHKLGQFSDAFEFYRQANAIRSALREYDAGSALNDMHRIRQSYSAVIPARSSGAEDNTPIFIVGLPRCGSTLVERILTSHSQVSGRGEMDAFASVLSERFAVKGDVDIAGLAALSDEQWAGAGGECLLRLREAGTDSPRIVDKSLNNFLLLGAIHRALPGARIVHVRRHPLDVCLSIYTSNIQGSLYDYGLNLQTLGEYCLSYVELMRHWRMLLPAGVMYELEYEQLVSNQEEETRKLLNACGLAWEDCCLQFQSGGGRVSTASIMQVRKPMYTGSVARWRHYERQLQPLIDILGTEYPDA